MKVVLYIGHHKVGSTALQQFFAQNAHRLMQAGILYPAVDSQALSYMLARALEGGDEVADLPMNVREPHNALAYRMWNHRKGYTVPAYHPRLPSMHQMKFFLDHQIEMLGPHTVILCSEVMANFGKVDLFLIDQIRTMFGPDVELEIYCALRRPDEYLISWHGQRLRFGGKFAALRDGGFETYFGDIHFDYQIMLRPWVERCTKARFHIRPYTEVMAAGGSTADFMDQIGVDFPEDLLPAPRLNTSYPHALYEIARQGNHALSREDAHALREFLVFARDDLDLPANAQVEMFGAENRETLYQAFLPIESWLRKVTGRDAFFADLENMRPARPLPELQVMQEALAALRAKDLGRKVLSEDTLSFLDSL